MVNDKIVEHHVNPWENQHVMTLESRKGIGNLPKNDITQTFLVAKFVLSLPLTYTDIERRS